MPFNAAPMTSMEAAVDAHAQRLEIKPGTPFTEELLDQIALRSGVVVPASCRYFLATYGTCESDVEIAQGDEEGRIVDFSEPDDILEQIEEFGQMGILPFAECLAGSFYALRSDTPEANVVFVDLGEERVVPLFDTFVDFLAGLRMTDWSRHQANLNEE